MLILPLTYILTTHLTLITILLLNPPLLLRILRISTTIYLILLGLILSEILREGLLINGSNTLHYDVRLAWTAWYVLVACSIFDWRLLVPAVVILAWFMSFDEVRRLLDYGLVRLGWMDLAYSPLSWFFSREATLRFGVWFRLVVVRRTVDYLVLPVLGPVKGLMDYAAGWVLQTGEMGLEKLRPPARWTWVVLKGRGS
ncbi:hypothetical protein GGS20DRAFT_572139 [Poronia punctata]|nr:hypothetical protein GGS20DRAFT_572139 [Poronia punctata]